MSVTLEQILFKLTNAKKTGSGWTAKCPAHEDNNPSLSITEKDGKILLNCQAGCETAQVLAALGLEWSDLFTDKKTYSHRSNGQRGAGVRNGKRGSKNPGGTQTAGPGNSAPHSAPGGAGGAKNAGNGLTLEELAEAKRLPVDFLHGLGLRTIKVKGETCVKIPYFDDGGNEVAVRYRLALKGQRFKWRSGDHVQLYGLWRLDEAQKAGRVLLVEGESDCWTCWHYGIPALGVPGKTNWRSEWKAYVDGLNVFLWCEPDAFDLVVRIAKDIPGLRVIYAPDGAKDPSALHIAEKDFPVEMETLINRAVDAGAEIAARNSAEIAALAEQAKAVLESLDPLVLIKAAIRKSGFGGDIKQPIIIYLSYSSRLLKLRHGQMLVHLLALGPSSVGKSYAVQIVARLHPEDAGHTIEAGSPRALIYDEEELRHRVLVFGEADSLPSGEDNPAASAIRNLLQDNCLHYDVVEKDLDTGGYRVRHIVKEGPTVLITSAVKPLGAQLMTRVFQLDMPADADQVKNALVTQARMETAGASDPDPALVAYQGYLQRLAPWDVIVPFAKALAEGIAPAAKPRILRDFQRLLSMIKAVAVLRHRHREKDHRGRLIATVDDYRFVYGLVREMYAASVTSASENVRRTVAAVKKLREEDKRINYSILAKEMKVHHDLVRRWVRTAIYHEWVVNKAAKGQMADLDVGEPLPDQVGLPDPETIPAPAAPGGAKRGAKIRRPNPASFLRFRVPGGVFAPLHRLDRKVIRECICKTDDGYTAFSQAVDQAAAGADQDGYRDDIF